MVKVGGAGNNLRPMARCGRRAAPFGEEGLDDAVLERMEGDGDETPRRLEHLFGGDEAVGQFAKLVIDENPQRLERAGGRMDRAVAHVHYPRDDVGERPRRIDRPLGAGADDGACDGARLALFAQYEQDRREVPLVGVGDDIGGARTVLLHAHVERPVEAEGKSARGLVDLHRGNAEVEHHAIDGSNAVCGQCRREVGEAVLDQRERPLGL